MSLGIVTDAPTRGEGDEATIDTSPEHQSAKIEQDWQVVDAPAGLSRQEPQHASPAEETATEKHSAPGEDMKSRDGAQHAKKLSETDLLRLELEHAKKIAQELRVVVDEKTLALQESEGLRSRQDAALLGQVESSAKLLRKATALAASDEEKAIKLGRLRQKLDVSEKEAAELRKKLEDSKTEAEALRTALSTVLTEKEGFRVGLADATAAAETRQPELEVEALSSAGSAADDRSYVIIDTVKTRERGLQGKSPERKLRKSSDIGAADPREELGRENTAANNADVLQTDKQGVLARLEGMKKEIDTLKSEKKDVTNALREAKRVEEDIREELELTRVERDESGEAVEELLSGLDDVVAEHEEETAALRERVAELEESRMTWWARYDAEWNKVEMSRERVAHLERVIANSHRT